LDKINPQIAARIATPLTRWEYVDNKHQDLIQNCLLELAKESLSSDLGEVVTKSLRQKNLK
jgi:aminopeptidase N